MARPLRIEYVGARYHLMSRGDRREPVFLDDQDRKTFLRTLGEACEKTGWEIHAYCLMGNHFHLVAETPQANLVAGMKWLLGTYTCRFNRRHRYCGHLFSGRYKSLVIDERSPGYLRTACDYAHLNPARAGIIEVHQPLSVFAWSSYPSYLAPGRRSLWLRVDRLLGEHGIQKDSLKGRSIFLRQTEQKRREGETLEALAALRRGWHLGAEDFLQRLTERLGRQGKPNEQASQRRETDLERAEQIVIQDLRRLGWTEENLSREGKGHPHKVSVAARLRRETPMTRRWIAERLHMGSASYVSHLLGK